MKLAIVVQRYGQAINGGAELHARYIAEHLARHADVEVLTTCATDYVTWANELEPGVDTINGVSVRRFPVKHERVPDEFGRWQERVFGETHSFGDELRWLDAEGPTSPALITHLKRHAPEYDYCVFFSYRYYHAYYGVRSVPSKAVLVPTAEREATIGLSLFAPIFRGVRAVMYNSHEERAMIHAGSGNQDVPGVVVGVGSDVPQNAQPNRFRQKYDIRGPFAIYVGRIDENKGCKELFEFFDGYLQNGSGRLSLVLVGNSLLPIPQHPRVRHLGFLPDCDKFDAMAAAELLIMPSYFESLSMVALEAWGLGRPVLANGHCDVLKGQCLRSNAGLYYESDLDFAEILRALEQNRWLSTTLGRNGRQFYRENYDWPVIEGKYLDMFERLSKESAARRLDPIPGWFARRRCDRPAAGQVLAKIPAGPSLGGAAEPGPRIRPQAPLPRSTQPPPAAPARPREQARVTHGDRLRSSAPNHQRRGGRPRRGGPPPRSGRW